jgi:hypothetical protein
MAKGKRQKDKQCNGQWKTTKGQTIKWPKENDQRKNNILDKEKREKDKQYNGEKKKRQKDKQYNGQTKSTKGQTI